MTEWFGLDAASDLEDAEEAGGEGDSTAVTTSTEAPPPSVAVSTRRRRREQGTLAWTMAKCLLLASILALGVSVWLAIAPVQNPGVQDCGAPFDFVVVNRTNVKVSVDGANAPPNASTLVLQPTCRERVDAQLVRALVAFGAFVGLGLLGAIIGLVDDRWQYHRAPRFETLLRERPADAPGRIRPPPMVRPEDVGRTLPPIEAPDGWILVVLSAVVIIGLSVFAGFRAVLDSIGSVGTVGLISLGVLEVVTLVIAAVQLWFSQPDPPPEPLAPLEVAEVGLAAAAATRVLPGLGPLGFDAHALVARGAARERVLRGQQARQFSGLAVHTGLLLIAALAAGITSRPPVALPASWWVVAALAGVLLVVGAGRGVGRWQRLVVKPRWAALRELAAGGRPERAGALVGSSLALALVNVATFVLACGLVSSIEGGLPATASLARLALIFLVAWTLATVAPTPGGVGVFEPVAVLGLLLAGLAVEPAVAAVLLFRVATFWLPIVIGLVPFTRLRRRWLPAGEAPARPARQLP